MGPGTLLPEWINQRDPEKKISLDGTVIPNMPGEVTTCFYTCLITVPVQGLSRTFLSLSLDALVCLMGIIAHPTL